VSYGVSSKDYLRRARRCLNTRTLQGLFYAAFELRCGIEARIHEYLDAQETVSKRKKRGWKIAKLARNLEAAFASGEHVIELTIITDNQRDGTAFYFTPVTANLRRMAERLGDYMHAMQRVPPSEEWWSAMRDYLEEVFEQLYQANAGTLLAPPIVNAKGEMRLIHELLPGENAQETSALMGRPGTDVIVQVRYLDSVPADGR